MSVKSIITNLIKAAVVFGLLYFLAKKGFLSWDETRRAFQHWQNVSLGFACLFVAAVMGVYRWQLLLRAQGFQIRFGRVFQLGLIGNFFNIALPGAVSGDFVKAFYVAKEVDRRPSHAFGSILFDRVVGLSALVLLSCTAMMIGFEDYPATAQWHALRVWILFAAGATVFFYAYLFFVQEKHDFLLDLLRWTEKKLPRFDSITRIYIAIREYRTQRMPVFKVLLFSILIHIIVTFSCLQFSRALGSGQMNWVSVAIVVPMGLLVTAVPIAPGGLGTGNAAFAALFRLLNFDRGGDVFSLFLLCQLTISAVGGLIYLRFRSKTPLPRHEDFKQEGIQA